MNTKSRKMKEIILMFVIPSFYYLEKCTCSRFLGSERVLESA
jgi:hypothetical protein